VAYPIISILIYFARKPLIIPAIKIRKAETLFKESPLSINGTRYETD